MRHENHIFRTVVATHHWEVAVQAPTWASEPIIPFPFLSRPSLAQCVQCDFRLQNFPIHHLRTRRPIHRGYIPLFVFIRLLYQDTKTSFLRFNSNPHIRGSLVHDSDLLATIFIPFFHLLLVTWVSECLTLMQERVTLERRANSDCTPMIRYHSY